MAVEVARVVNASGLVSLSGQYVSVGQTLRVGGAHRHLLIDVEVHDDEFHVCDQARELVTTIPRTSG